MNHRSLFSLITMATLSIMASAQQLPQFSSGDFEGWNYNNPGVPLTGTAIASGNVYLYVSTDGLVLTLQSPEFSCQGLDSISVQLYWYSPNCNDSEFDLSRTALTMAIDDTGGNPIDSVTYQPPQRVISQTLQFGLRVPRGLATGRIRFVAWRANVTSCGAIKRALFTGVNSVLKGDIDNDGSLTVSDVTALIDGVLHDMAGVNPIAADVDEDGDISVSDVTTLITRVLY